MIPPEEILAKFDEYVQRVEKEISSTTHLRKAISDYKSEINSLNEQLQHSFELLKEKDRIITQQNDELLKISTNIATETSQLCREMDSSSKLVQSTYEIEILQSNKRVLEKELKIQRNENERLQLLKQTQQREASIREGKLLSEIAQLKKRIGKEKK